jgi:predicted component of type VI protein secretion system
MRGLLERLAPEKLEAAIEGKSGGLGGMFKGRKALSWEAYTRVYAALADEAEADFRDLFRREFARAYQDQLERLK